MGQTLSVAAVDKETEVGQNDRFGYSISAMQGWRITMEDAHAIVLNLDDSPEKSNSYFAIYDGHGGASVAKYAGENVHKRLVKEEAYQEKRYEEALKKSFLGTDEDLLGDPQYARETSGCTAVAALVTQDKIYVANAGDSRSVLSVKGQVKPLSFDHKPTNDDEKRRIVNAGGYVEAGRVNGNLALSRGIGDFSFKKNYSLKPEEQIITADPDVSVHDIGEDDEFLVLACDGIWDCLESQEVVDFIRHELAEGLSLNDITELICNWVIAPDTSSGTGCDNMTILVIALLHGRTMDEWYDWIKERVEKGIGYKTRRSRPRLYNADRVMSFWKRIRDWYTDDGARPSLHREDAPPWSDPPHLFPPDSEFYGGNPPVVSRRTGGLSPQHGGSILSDSGRLMFEQDGDSDSDEGGIITLPGLGGLHDHSSLKAQLAAFEKEGDDSSGDDSKSSPAPPSDGSPDLDVLSSPESTSGSQQLPNGDAMKLISPVEQLAPLPSGDAADPVSRIEGLMDTSESPLKA